MNSRNSKTPDPHRLLLNLLDKINLKRSDKHFALSNLSIYYTWRNRKNYTKTINLKYKLQREMASLNDLTDRHLYQIFKIVLSTF